MYKFILKELKRLDKEGRNIRVAAVGTGFIGRGMIIQSSFMKGIDVTIIYARDINKLPQIIASMESKPVARICNSIAEVKLAEENKEIALVDDIELVYISNADVVVDTTGSPSFGAEVAYNSILAGKHIVTNPEMDICIGTELKRLADDKGVVYSGQDGDEPGVVNQLYDYVSILGFDITALGKFKNFTDIHANPESVKPWSDAYKQSPYKIASFADGTKMNIEMGLVCNATGHVPDVRGLHQKKAPMEDIVNQLRPIAEGGILNNEKVVDIVPGVQPSGGVFVVAKSEHPQVISDMAYYKMGDGPYYLFWRPYHLCSVEMLVGVADICLNKTATIEPISYEPVVDVAAFAKRNLVKGTKMDMIGGFDFYGLVDKFENYSSENILPISLAEGAILTRDIGMDEIITLNDIELNETQTLWKFREKLSTQYIKY